MSKFIEQNLLDILAISTIDENKLYLPKTIVLERSDYLIIDSCLRRLGGKWNRKGYHLFPSDPTPGILAVLETKYMPADNPLAYFPTPLSVVNEIVDTLNLYHANLILEPSAGQGAFIDEILKLENSESVKIHYCEYDPINRSILEQKYKDKTNVICVGEDFLQFSTDNRYDYIVMNPPFSVDGDSSAYITHILHAWNFLHQKGILISIVPGGWETKTQKKFVEFREWIADKLDWYEFIPEKTFKDTTISTRIIHLSRNNRDTESYNGYFSYLVWEFFLYMENEEKLYKMWINPIFTFDQIEQETIQQYLPEKYLPLRNVDREELKRLRFDDGCV